MFQKYNPVEVMHPYIERLHKVYAQDLSDHLSLNDRHLSDALVTPTLLNPLFGKEKRNCWVWIDVRRAVLQGTTEPPQKMQDIHDKNNPLLCYT